MTPASCQWEIDTKTTITLPWVPCLLSFAEMRFKYLVFHVPLTVQAKQNTRGLRWPSGDLLQARTGRLGRREVLESIWEYGGEKRGQGKAGFSDPIGREPS